MGELLKQETTQATAISRVVDQMKGQWAKVLPKICTPERFARVALSCINSDPTLAAAMMTQSGKISCLSAFMKCAEMGLEPDKRRAALVAYKKGTPRQGEEQKYEITLIPMFQGLSELAMRSGLISCIHADKICENDEFDWNIGKIIKHRPNFKGDRGKTYAFYCHVQFKDGAVKDEIMTIDEINAIRDRSSAWQSFKKYGKECPWNTDYEEMAKKTVFRRASKWLPLSAELREAVETDDSDYIDVPATVQDVSRFDKPAELTAPVSPEVPEQTDLEKLQVLIDQKGIPVSAETVKSFVEKSGDMFSYDMVAPNIDAIAAKMEGAQ